LEDDLFALTANEKCLAKEQIKELGGLRSHVSESSWERRERTCVDAQSGKPAVDGVLIADGQFLVNPNTQLAHDKDIQRRI
jgi:hypothetical protein